MDTMEPTNLAPAVIVPKPFVLSEQPKAELDKLRDEIIDKQKQWENNFNTFFTEYDDMANNYRFIPRKQKIQKGFFNSITGETHRAVNTLSTLEFRMLTAADPFFDVVAQGLKENGTVVTEQELYDIAAVLVKQMRVLKFKKKLKRSLTSKKLFGTSVVEEPWVSLPYGNNMKYFEGTDFVPRSLIQVGFDPYIYDIEESDYVFTIDYLTKYKIRNYASDETQVWDKALIEEAIKDQESWSQYKDSHKKSSVYNLIERRKQRAGYSDSGSDLFELLTYHGRLDTSNPVLKAYWDSEGRTDDIKFCDFTMGILNTDTPCRLHATPYGTWRHIFKVSSDNDFELEPIGYGVGRVGKKTQAEIDTTQSRMHNLVKMALFGMWKVGRYAGFKANDFNIKPLNIIQLDDINQLEPIRPDLNAVAMALQIQDKLRESFRNDTGAVSNLQAIVTKATATESSIAQNEAIRAASVLAEITAETFLREHLETMHINNTDLLDADIFVSWTGSESESLGVGMNYNRHNLPKNIGIEVKTTTDKDFRPDRNANLLSFIQAAFSIRNEFPEGINMKEAFVEYARGLGMNPRKFLPAGLDLKTRLINQMRQSAGNEQLAPELDAEMNGDASGAGSNISTPVGEVPTSPNSELMGGLSS